ncbi:outer membrane beta-barrel protein [Rhizorhabdus argentea]|uniref:outer membrane beta-barrel protein n=1 Tax=Rhizorhabdus argentea TaxID=1387174 RepID=UPI0030ECB9D4
MDKPWRTIAVRGLGALCSVLVYSAPQAALAQASDLGPFLGSPIPLTADHGRNVSVSERPRPESDPIGIHLGGFTAFPSITVGLAQSSNVFASPRNPKGDAYLSIEPLMKLTSNWATNALQISGGGSFRRYAKTSLKNESSYFGGVNGRLDIDRDSAVDGTALIRRAYQAQSSSSAPGSARRSVSYMQTAGLLRGYRQFGPVRVTLVTDVNKFDFNDLHQSNRPTIDQDFRDETVIRGGGRFEYAVGSDASVFVEANYADISHRLKTLGTQPNRDGNDLTALGGVTFDLTNLVRVRAGVGYVRRRLEARTVYRPISGLAYDGRLEYFLSGITTVSVAASRSIEESITTGSGGYFSNTRSVRVDHELLRNLILYGQGEWQHNVFKGIARKDDILVARGGGDYAISQGLSVGANLKFLDRRSRGQLAGDGFKEWLGSVSITIRR